MKHLSFVTGGDWSTWGPSESGPGCLSDWKCLFTGVRLSDLTDNVHVRGPQDPVGERARRVGRSTSTAYGNLAAGGGEAASYDCILREGGLINDLTRGEDNSYDGTGGCGQGLIGRRRDVLLGTCNYRWSISPVHCTGANFKRAVFSEVRLSPTVGLTVNCSQTSSAQLFRAQGKQIIFSTEGNKWHTNKSLIISLVITI